ncbi:RNA 2',3'-cyclic phosphodiesterase [Marinicrinis lubricantis]|uniref:RNA 2',3'-cyclic phosphodiesterase n=1 Tax=Marinicrinis lubricantis TaxID=2086470 RepID=A0ABW1IKA7_9BACL
MKTDQPIRIFLALPLPKSIQEAIHEESELLRSKLTFRKWVHPRDYHITVQFLGEADPSLVHPLTNALSSALQALHPFPLEIGHWGWFGRKQRPSILWKGVHDPEDVLPELAAKVRNTTSQFHFEDDGKPFKAHITVARQYTGELFPAHLFLDEESSLFGSDNKKPPLEWEAQSITLYESRLGQKPMYSPLQSIEWKS